jgi:orotate phosphoribosyltransferase
LLGKEVLALCADKVEKGGETSFVIKRGQEQFVANGKKILVVEDILTTGGSVKKVVDVVREMGGEVVGVGALCNRGGITPDKIGDVPVLKALMNVKLEAFDESDCPYCKNEVPINVSVGKGLEYVNHKAQGIGSK